MTFACAVMSAKRASEATMSLRKKREKRIEMKTANWLSVVVFSDLCLRRFGPKTIPRLLAGIQLCLILSGVLTLHI